MGAKAKASEGKIGEWADNWDETIQWAQRLSIDRYANTAQIRHFSLFLVRRPVGAGRKQPVDETDLNHDEQTKGYADQP
jgi:hypothetical protein